MYVLDLPLPHEESRVFSHMPTVYFHLYKALKQSMRDSKGLHLAECQVDAGAKCWYTSNVQSMTENSQDWTSSVGWLTMHTMPHVLAAAVMT